MARASTCVPVVVGVSLAASSASASPTFTALATSSSQTTIATAVSADGSTAVFYSNNVNQGYWWNRTTGIHAIPVSTGLYQPTGVSGDGSIIVGNTPNVGVPLRTTTSGDTQALPRTGAAGVYAISSDGSTAVGFNSGSSQAVRWTASGRQSLGAPSSPPSFIGGVARAVDADGGVIVGSFTTSFINSLAFRWTPEAGMVSLGTLPGMSYSRANGVSADGAVVVGEAEGATGLPMRAFRWTAQSGMQDLGLLPNTQQSNALCISGNGQIIGGYCSETGTGRAIPFIWTAALGMVDFRTYATSLGLNTGAFTMASICGLSVDGSTVVGNGGWPSANQGFVVTGVPGPGASTLLGLGAGYAARRRRMRARCR